MNRVLPRLTRWYLRKARRAKWQDIEVIVPPGVFHPSLFFSTRFMMRHLEKYHLLGLNLLEIGGGSGMISIWAANRGASVTCTDISPNAIEAIIQNAKLNGVGMEVVHSDLFERLPMFEFDLIVVNPPYYPSLPSKEADFAWYCGPNHEYFDRLFSGMHVYLKKGAQCLMVLSEDCDIKRIRQLAERHGWQMEPKWSKQILGEWNFIYLIQPA